MPIEYHVIPRKNPQNRRAPAKFYASAVSTGELTMRQLSKRIAEMSTISTADTMAVLEAFVQIVPQEIADGKIVRLGDFGSFRLTIQSKGEALEKNVNDKSITGNTLHFNPGAEVDKVLDSLSYKKIKKKP